MTTRVIKGSRLLVATRTRSMPAAFTFVTAAARPAATPRKSRNTRGGRSLAVSTEVATSGPLPASVTAKPVGSWVALTERSSVAASRVTLLTVGSPAIALAKAGGLGANVGTAATAGLSAIALAEVDAPGARSTSTRTVLRALRTRYLAARSSLTRTRATGEPSGALARSIATVATGASIAATGKTARFPACTSRRSTRTVSGSGWLVRYATGSLASISTVLTAPSRRDEIERRAGVSAPAS